VLDLSIMALLVFVSIFLAHKVKIERFPINDALIFAVILGYEVVLPTVANGATIGRLVTRIRLVRETDRLAPSFAQYFARTVTRLALFALFAIFLAYEIDLEAFVFVCVLEGVICAVRTQRQTLGDLVARTLVLKRAALITTAT
jgi:uncharacterized RDD family membrane protein YckC